MSIRTNLALYADDTTIYTSAYHPFTLYKNLLTHTDAFMSWCALWRIEINERKTTAVYFSRRHTNLIRRTINNEQSHGAMKLSTLGSQSTII